MDNSTLMAVLGIVLIILLITLAKHNSCESETEPEKHTVMRIVAWVLAVIGVVYLISYLSTVLKAGSTAEIRGLSPFLFVIFGLSGYFFYFRKSNTTIGRKILKTGYVMALIVSYELVFVGTSPLFFEVIFILLAIYGGKKTESKTKPDYGRIRRL